MTTPKSKTTDPVAEAAAAEQAAIEKAAVDKPTATPAIDADTPGYLPVYIKNGNGAVAVRTVDQWRDLHQHHPSWELATVEEFLAYDRRIKRELRQTQRHQSLYPPTGPSFAEVVTGKTKES